MKRREKGTEESRILAVTKFKYELDRMQGPVPGVSLIRKFWRTPRLGSGTLDYLQNMYDEVCKSKVEI